MMNLLSTHDTMRLLTVLGGEDPKNMNKKQMAEYKIPDNKFESAVFKSEIGHILSPEL